MDFNLTQPRIVIDFDSSSGAGDVQIAAAAWLTAFAAIAVGVEVDAAAGAGVAGTAGPGGGGNAFPPAASTSRTASTLRAPGSDVPAPALRGTSRAARAGASGAREGAAPPVVPGRCDRAARRSGTSGSAGSAGVEQVRRRVYAMGTLLTGTAWADRRPSAVAALEAAVRAVESAEDRLSTWRGDTELAALNAAPAGRRIDVGDSLLAMLSDARRWWRATDGAFDPGVGRLVDAWDLRGEGRVPSPAELRDARAASGMGCWELHPENGAVTPRCEGAWIDAGAFGKGAGLRAAEEALRTGGGAGGALLDFGGHLLAVGTPPDGGTWTVGVAHPSRRGEPVAELAVADVSVATTSASERVVVVDGERRGHVLDPRTGEPVPPWGSVTVLAEDPFAADALSTALFVLGPEEAKRRARALDDVGVLVLEEDESGLRAAWNGAMERHLSSRPSPHGTDAPPGTAAGPAPDDEAARRGATGDGPQHGTRRRGDAAENDDVELDS